MTELTVEERLVNLENYLTQAFSLLALVTQKLEGLAHVVFSQSVPAAEHTPVPTEQPPIPQVPEEGWLDCESYVAGRTGTLDMRQANQLGQITARAGLTRGIEPKKISHPGEHWREINTWPIEFLREMWYLTYGGTP